MKKSNPFLDIVISILVPSVILMRMSGDDKLGPTMALIVALAFPLGYGLYELFVNNNRNGVAVLGVISVLLTGKVWLPTGTKASV